MSQVGSGFGSFRPRMRVARIPKNPMDKCTIVSIAPFEVVETKVTLFPGHYVIPKAEQGKFSTLVVEASSWFRDQSDGMPTLEIPVGSTNLAESIIRDYCNGLIGYVRDIASPGLFFLYGAHDEVTVQLEKNFKPLMRKAHEVQTNWFKELIRIADIGWARTDGNPLAINNDARMAAEFMNLKNKPWMQDFSTMEKTNCKACGHMVNTVYPICPNCRAIVNEAKATELNIKFAAV